MVAALCAYPAQGQWNTTNGGPPIYYNLGPVGIGTTSPQQPLDVNAGVGGSTGGILLQGGGDNGTYTSLQFQHTDWRGGYTTPWVDNLVHNGVNYSSIPNANGGLDGSLQFYAVNDMPMQLGTNNSAWLTITTAGQVGIGTTSPVTTLQVDGSAVIGSSASGETNVALNGGGPPNTRSVSLYYNRPNETGYLQVGYGGVSNNPLAINPYGGNVGIGVANPLHLLHVAGAIGAEEVIVSSTGADYVFRPDYRLRPLTEVNAYINENHHLPGIPSEAEVKERGVSLGDMQTKLLAKIEELTLHMIRAEERSVRVEQELRARNLELQKRLDHLEGR